MKVATIVHSSGCVYTDNTSSFQLNISGEFLLRWDSRAFFIYPVWNHFSVHAVQSRKESKYKSGYQPSEKPKKKSKRRFKIRGCSSSNISVQDGQCAANCWRSHNITNDQTGELRRPCFIKRSKPTSKDKQQLAVLDFYFSRWNITFRLNNVLFVGTEHPAW